MDKGELPPPYPGPPMVQTNIPYQTQQGSYQTQPGSSQTQPGFSQTQPGSNQTQPGSYQTQPGPYQTQPAPGVYNPQPAMSPIPQGGQYPAPAQVVTVQPQLAEVSGEMKCVHCQQQIVTETKYIIGMTAWWTCILIGVLLLWPFCFIPLCLKACKDVEHRCPNCKKVVHIYRRQ